VYAGLTSISDSGMVSERHTHRIERAGVGSASLVAWRPWTFPCVHRVSSVQCSSADERAFLQRSFTGY
jgi:hypothetical protein